MKKTIKKILVWIITIMSFVTIVPIIHILKYLKWLKGYPKHIKTTSIGLIGLFALNYYVKSIFIKEVYGLKTAWEDGQGDIMFKVSTVVGLILIIGFVIGMVIQPYTIYRRVTK